MITLTNLISLLLIPLTIGYDIPQLIKTYKDKNVESFSLTMIIMRWCVIGLWSLYGFLIGNLVIGLVNLTCLCLVTTLIYMILKYRRNYV